MISLVSYRSSRRVLNFTLIKESIKKWQAIVGETGDDKGAANCPLCKKYNSMTDCAKCPIAKDSGKAYCKNTPYESWARHHRINHVAASSPLLIHNLKVECHTCLELATEELTYLIKLYNKILRTE